MDVNCLILNFTLKAKAAQRDNELITNNTAGQAYVEQQALKLFLYADQCDRAGNFSPYLTSFIWKFALNDNDTEI